MPQSATLIDAPAGETVRHGSQTVTFGTAGGPFVAEEIQFTKGTRELDIPNLSGQDSKAAYSTVKGKGTMTVQFKTATTPVIAVGDSFTVFIPSVYNGDIPCFVTAVGISYIQGDVTKIPISFAEWLYFSDLPKTNFYDGDFAQAVPSGPVKVHQAIPFIVTALVGRQTFHQLAANRVVQAIGTAGPDIQGLQSYLVEETEPQDMGGGVVSWDRVWASIPGTTTVKGTAVKVFKYLFKGWTGAALTAAAIVTQPKTINVDIIYSFGLTAPQIGQVPDITVVHYANSGFGVWATGGFPFNGAQGSPIDHNEGYFTISGEVDYYMGKIYRRKEVKGST